MKVLRLGQLLRAPRLYVAVLPVLLTACGTFEAGVETPPASPTPAPISITGIVRDVVLDKRTIHLQEAVDGIGVVVLTQGSSITYKDGSLGEVEDLGQGTEIRVTGVPTTGSTLTAEQVVIIGGDPVGTIGGRVWHDLCTVGEDGELPPATPLPSCIRVNLPTGTVAAANGVLEDGEPGIGGVHVELGGRACPSAGLATTTTGPDGRYVFPRLRAGTYCVTVNPHNTQNAPILLPGSWTYPAGNGDRVSATVTLAPGQEKPDVLFGWDYQFLPDRPAGSAQAAEPSNTVPTAQSSNLAPTQAPCAVGTFNGKVDLIEGPDAFCVVWKDLYPDETAFRIVLSYYSSGENFTYETPPNTTQFVLPQTDAPLYGKPLEECSRRSSLTLSVYALRPIGEVLVDSMARDGGC